MREIRQARYVMGTVVEIVADNCVENLPLRGAAGLSLQEMSRRGPRQDIPLHALQKGNRPTLAPFGTWDATAVVHRALQRFEFLERKFSRFDRDSELSQVNRQAAEEPVQVSMEFFELISLGIEYSQKSEGAFSIALAPLVRLWTQCAAEERFPTNGEINEAQRRSDFRCIRLNRPQQTIQFEIPGAGLDLGGLVKGYAVDEAAKILQKGGISRALIDAGNSSLAAFAPHAGKSYRIGLRHPAREQRLAGTILLANGSLSTSGTYEREWHFQGRNMSHLIDSRTGAPLSQMSSATALCQSALLAEVASKVLLFHGCRSGIALCDANGWAVEGAVLETGESEHDSRLERSNDFPFLPIVAAESPLTSRLREPRLTSLTR